MNSGYLASPNINCKWLNPLKTYGPFTLRHSPIPMPMLMTVTVSSGMNAAMTPTLILHINSSSLDIKLTSPFQMSSDEKMILEIQIYSGAYLHYEYVGAIPIYYYLGL